MVIVLSFYSISYAQQGLGTDTVQRQVQDSSINRKISANNYQGILEGGYAWGLGEWGRSVFRLNAVNAIRLSNYSIGFGLGFSILNHNQNQYDNIRFEYQVPIYIDNRLYFSKRRLQPYLAFGFGLSIVAHDMLADLSLFLNSSTGVFWKISERISLVIGIAYESYNIKYDSFPRKYSKLSNAIGVNAGISF